MDLATKIASEITIFSKYARYLPAKKRRETWAEIVQRYIDMMVKKYPSQELQIQLAGGLIYEKKVLPSMRMLQFAGPPIEKNNSRGYNCGFLKAKKVTFFKTLIFLLLGGTGVGYSVQNHHVLKLPTIKKPGKSKKWLVGDSIEGWADSVGGLMRAFFLGKPLPKFDYSDIREKGALLVTAGGKAPGPGPLRICHDKILALLETKPEGSQLTSTEVSDIACYLADAVLAGGIRRAAMIALFDSDDKFMLNYKSGAWWEVHPERGRVNVSAVLNREHLTEDEFKTALGFTRDSGSGEPGVYLTNNLDWGTNPCGEIALRSEQFCNLSTINLTTVKDQADLNVRATVAAFLGTLQAGFTDFHYLDHKWEENSKEEALLGISITGVADQPNAPETLDFKEACAHAVKQNQITAKLIGINEAARVTCIKPEGTASLVLGTASGIHGRHAPFYIRRFRFGRNEPIALYLANKVPSLVVEDQRDPNSVVLELPQKSPAFSIMRQEPPLAVLERVKFFKENWINPGHKSGDNTHNVSVTVNVKDEEWDEVINWMWENQEAYNGISLFPYDAGTYVQAPFEECTEEVYNEMLSKLTDIDLSEVVEDNDSTELVQEAACAGGKCEI